MEKRSKSDGTSLSKVGIAIEPVLNYTNVEQSIVVRSKFPAMIKLTGRISDKPYVWEKAGSVVEVEAADWPTMKEMRMGNAFCCFGDNANYLFEEVV